MLGLLDINELGWMELFGSNHPSVVATQATNPRDTDVSTADTIALMDQYANEDSRHPIVIRAAEEIRDSYNLGSDSREKDISKAVFQYVKDHVRFVEDETTLNKLFGIDSDVELLIRPSRLLSMRNAMGDCDDFSMLTKSLLLALDVNSSYITVAADKAKPRKWSHVYVLTDREQIPVDTSHGKYLGWEAPEVSREQVWDSPISKIRNRKIDMTVDHNGNGLGMLGDYGDGSDPAYDALVDSQGGGGSMDWSSILAPLTKAGTSIAMAQFGQPQLAPGTFIRRADGSILTNQPIGTGSLFGGGAGTGLGSSGLLIGVAVIGGLFLLLKK